MEQQRKGLQTTTKPVCLGKLCPEILDRELIRVRTTQEALALSEYQMDKYPSLSVLRRDYGSEKIEGVIELFLIDLSENVNLKRPLSGKQMANIAREVVATYWNLTIADVHVIFRKAKSGEYGEFYESLDMPKVMGWFRYYFKNRCEIAEEQSVSGAYYDKGGNMTQGRMSEYFNKLQKRIRR